MENAAVAAAPAVTAVDVPWGAVWGQDEAVATLRAAASDPEAMTHAWLITGPPGSGRSTLAYAFAAALIAEEGDEQTMRQVLAGTHPDMTALRTEGVIISIKDARCAGRALLLRPVARTAPGHRHGGCRPHGRAHLQRAAQGARGAAGADRVGAVRTE